jgi:hypothetical protein
MEINWNRRVKEMRRELENLFKKNQFIDWKFYTPKEWGDRGEKYGQKSLLTLTFEGELYDIFNYGSDPDIYSAMVDICYRHKIYWEQGFAWTAHFYKEIQ